jgi:DNA-binding CsgD family transcriptional regulator/tetratricopeptide (TPR) repeat protein
MAQQTGGELAARLAAGAPREALFAAFLDELARPPSPGPAGPRRQVVVVEDVHWADAATLDLLVFLGRRLDRVAATLVLTVRDDELGADHPLRGVLSGLPSERVHELRPAPLSAAAVEELARRAGANAPALHPLTGGNPLLVTEVLAAGEVQPPAPVPRTVADLVAARRAALPEEAQQVVRLVSVVPTATELALLDAVLRPDPDAVEACAAGGLLVLGPHSIAFRHELLRHAVEASLSPLRRRDLNRRVLAALVAQGDRVDPARLAHHAREADDGPAVLRFATAAAERAASLGAHREAAGHYRSALAHADGIPSADHAHLLEQLAYHAYLLGAGAEALQARQQALALREADGAVESAGDDWRWISRLHWWLGDRAPAEHAAARAIEVLSSVEPGRGLAMAYSNQSQLDMLARRVESAIIWGERALDLARRLGDVDTQAHALVNTGSARGFADPARGSAELEEAVALAEAHDLPDHGARALVNLTWAALEERDYVRAEADLARGLRFAFDRDLGGYLYYLVGTRSWWRLERGDWAGAERDAREVLGRSELGGSQRLPSLVTLSRLLSRRGSWEEAAATLDEARRRVSTLGEVQRLAPVGLAAAELAWLSGDADRIAAARADAERAFAAAVETGHPWWTGELAFRLVRLGAEPDVPTRVAEPYARALAGDVRGAAAVFAELGCPYDEADVLSESADEADLVTALRRFDELGAAASARRLRQRLAQLGVARVPRGPRPATVANPAGLTARQLDVLELVAVGMPNAAIATKLSLSVRTVDHHVSAVLAKLGVGSRAEVAAAAARLGVGRPQDGQQPGPI